MAFPENTADLNLWLDGDVSVLTSVAPDVACAEYESVMRWQCANGTGRNVGQTTAANKPAWGANVGNGNGGVVYDGTNDQLASSTTMLNLITATTFTVLLAFRVAACNTNSGNKWTNDAIVCDESGYWGLFVDSTGLLWAYNWDTAAKTCSRSYTLGTTHVACWRKEGGTMYLSVDGGAESSVAVGAITLLTGALSTGNRTSVGAFFRGAIHELLIWDVALTTTERDNNIAHMVSKYAQTEAGHNWSPQLIASGGRLDSLACHGSTLWTAGRSPNAGKLYESTNGGASWSLKSTTGTADINTVAAESSSIIWMLDENSIVYRSADGGTSFTNKGQRSTATPVGGFSRSYGLLITSDGTALVADMASSGGHIHRSIDDGDSWTDLGAIGASGEGLYRIVVGYAGKLLCNSTAGRIYSSTDDGATWSGSSVIESSACWAIEYLGSQIWLLGFENGKIYRSTDNGTSWTLVATLNGAADDFVYCGGSRVLYCTYTQNKWIYQSSDSGQTWSLWGYSAGAEGDRWDHAIWCSDANKIVAVTNLGYVMTSEDNSNAGFKSYWANRTQVAGVV